MKYINYKTDGTADVITLDTPIQYEMLRELVAGSIEGYRTQQGQLIYCNEEGRLDGLPSNPFYSEDIRGNTVEYLKVDEEGESIGFDDDYTPRSVASLPPELFEKGKKFTIFWISDSWGATVDSEIVTSGRASSDGKPVFKLKGKRKDVRWSCKTSEVMIFRGHDLPIKNANNIGRTIRMNALYNMSSLGYEQLRGYVRDHQINPFFVFNDHVNYVSEQGNECLLFPHAPATNQRIADMQSKQLGDGIERIVISGE